VVNVGLPNQAWSEEKKQKGDKKVADGIYAILREGLQEMNLLPLKPGERLLTDTHPYLNKDEKEAPRFLVLQSVADVELDLAHDPTAVKEGDKVVRILLELEPKAATALERLTNRPDGRQLAIVLGGEVVTVHKIRDTIRGGKVQITSCAGGAADYLFNQLQAHTKRR